MGHSDGVEPPADYPAWTRLLDQLDLYDRKSLAAQRAFKRLEVLKLVLEAVQHLYQWPTNWVLYHSTAAALKHKKHLFLSSAGPHSSVNQLGAPANRIEGLTSQEQEKWTQGREPADREHRPAG